MSWFDHREEEIQDAATSEDLLRVIAKILLALSKDIDVIRCEIATREIKNDSVRGL